MERMIGTVSRGVRAPIIREGDDIAQIVVDSVLEAAQGNFTIQDKDVVGGDRGRGGPGPGQLRQRGAIAKDVSGKFGDDTVGVLFPILSRNRFAICLRGIAKGCQKDRADAQLPLRRGGQPSHRPGPGG